MKNHLTIILILGFLAVNPVTSAWSEMYIWTDQNGVKHYSNEAPAESAEQVEIADEIEHVPLSDQSARQKEEEGQYWEREVQIRKRNDALEKARWREKKLQIEAEEAQKKKKRENAISTARNNVQYIEERLESYEALQRKHGRKYYEKQIREVSEELYQAKKELRAMELHGEFD